MQNGSIMAVLQDGVNKAHGLAETGTDLLVLRLRALEAVIDSSDLSASLELREVQDTVSHWREVAMGGVEALKDVHDTYIQATEMNFEANRVDVLIADIARFEVEIPKIMVSEEADALRCIATFECDSLFAMLRVKKDAGKPFTLKERALAALTRFSENYDALKLAIHCKEQIAGYRATNVAGLAHARECLDIEKAALERRRTEGQRLVENGISNTVRAISVINSMFGNGSDEFNRIDFRLVTMIAREAAASNVRKMHLHPDAPSHGMSIPMEAQQEELIARFATARREVMAWLSGQKVKSLTVRPA
jgi:hypothetical protein